MKATQVGPEADAHRKKEREKLKKKNDARVGWKHRIVASEMGLLEPEMTCGFYDEPMKRCPGYKFVEPAGCAFCLRSTSLEPSL